jgi:glyoxylase-like metal-dependent hydrolase (beta-lactamase superfamily II)
MGEIKILLAGYAKKINNGWKANSTVVLIKENGKYIICDPGIDRKKLLSALKKEKLKTSDIDYVFLSHGHIDHSLLAGVFENASIIDELYIYAKSNIVRHNGKIPGTKINIIRTPGHKEEHGSLLVNTEQGIYAVAADVFWWADGQKQEVNIKQTDNDPEHADMKKLVASRKKILEMADYIIPGHGKMFKVNK